MRFLKFTLSTLFAMSLSLSMFSCEDDDNSNEQTPSLAGGNWIDCFQNQFM
jgi:uncharacterized lipoprotein YehR (DUF1307 family)